MIFHYFLIQIKINIIRAIFNLNSTPPIIKKRAVFKIIFRCLSKLIYAHFAYRICGHIVKGFKLKELTFLYHKLVKRSHFNTSAVIHNDYAVGISYCRQPVRNDKRCSAFCQMIYRLLSEVLISIGEKKNPGRDYGRLKHILGNE